MLQGICPFHLGYQIFWCIIVHSFSYNAFYFCKVGSDISTCISDFSYLSFLFSLSVSIGLSILKIHGPAEVRPV